jgi:hypothetical protein
MILVDWDEAVGYPNSPVSHLSIEERITGASKWNAGFSQRITKLGNFIYAKR